MNLAFIGSINDEILDKTELAAELARFLMIHYRGMMEERYQLEEGTDYELTRCWSRLPESAPAS